MILVLLNMLHDMYGRHDVECDTCRSLDGLLDLMQTKDHDLPTADLKMPEVNGHEVLELHTRRKSAIPRPSP